MSTDKHKSWNQNVNVTKLQTNYRRQKFRPLRDNREYQKFPTICPLSRVFQRNNGRWCSQVSISYVFLPKLQSLQCCWNEEKVWIWHLWLSRWFSKTWVKLSVFSINYCFIYEFPVTYMWSNQFDENLFRLTYVVERRGGGIKDRDFWHTQKSKTIESRPRSKAQIKNRKVQIFSFK